MSQKKNREVVKVAQFTTGFLKNLVKDGRFVSVNFTKKSDGSNRTLNGKNFIKDILTGGEEAYDAESKGQVRVVDVNIRKDRKGNPVPRHSEFRAVVTNNIHWVTANGKKYVAVADKKPELNFVQSVTYNRADAFLRLVLSGVVYIFWNVPKEVHQGLVDAENKGKFFNENIKDKFRYTRIG